MKKILLFLLTVMVGLGSLTLSAQNTLTVADGSETNSYIPVYGLWADDDQHNQVIYPASMLTQMLNQSITSMTFYPTSIPSWGNIIYTVSLSVTNDSAFATSSLITGSMDVVYTGHVDVVNNQLVFAFDDAFTYTGGNLVFDLQTTSDGSYNSATFNGINTSYNSSFYTYSMGSNTQTFIPKATFTYDVPETCIKPNELQISGVTNSSALFSWHPRSTGTSYVAIGTADADVSTLTWTVVTDTTYTFTGLDAGTLYVAYVKTDCGGGDESSPTSRSFYTYCDAVSQFPWFEGFEGDWQPAIAFGQENYAPGCWKVFHGGEGSSKWTSESSSNYTYEGSGSAAYYSYNNSTHNEWLVSPLLNIPANQTLSFFAETYDDYYGLENISIWISDENPTLTAPASDTAALPGFTQIAHFTNLPTDWYMYEVPLTNYTGNRYIAFVRKGGNSAYYLLLDEVSVATSAACLRPTALAADSVGPDYAILSWQSDATEFNVYYRKQAATNFDVVTGVTLGADSTYTLTGLTMGQAYEWYVSAICDEDTLPSYFTSPFGTFNTECVPLTELPYTWDFESNLIAGTADYPLPACWSRPDYTFPYIYQIYNYSTGGYSGVLACGNVSYYASYDGDPKIVVLPELESNIPVANLQVNLWARTNYYNSAQNYPTFIEVGVMTDPDDASTFTPIDTTANINTTNTEFQLELSGYSGTGNYVALRMHPGKYYNEYNDSYSNNTLYVDDMTLSLIPSCPRPEAVTVTNVTSDAATLTWSSGESSFMVYYKVHGTAAYTAIEDGPVSDTTYTLTDLTPNTNYDVYVASVCADETETPSIGASFTTFCVALDSVPVYYDFETGNTAGTSTYPLPSCWTRGPGSTSYPYTYDYYSYQGTVAMCFSGTNTAAMPAINTEETPISSLMVSFYAKYFYEYNASAMQVGVMTDPTDPATFVQVGNNIPLTMNYTLYEQSLGEYQGTGAYIAFRIIGVGSASSPSAYMDNLLVSPLPDCIRPMSFTSTVGVNEATITWAVSEDQEEWAYALGNAGDNPDTLNSHPVFTNTVTLENLDNNTTYTIFVKTICGSEESNWSEGYSFTTLLSAPAQLPYHCSFEDNDENANWMLVNGSLTNQWVIGTAVNNTSDGAKALYVSADSGITNTYFCPGSYSDDAYTTIWAYRDIQFSDASEFNLSFDWKCLGDISYGYYTDYMSVYIGDPVNVSANNTYSTSVPSSLTLIGEYAGTYVWNTESVTLDGAQYANTVKRLYFRWYNKYYDCGDSAGAVDNIHIVAASCARPTNVELVANNIGSATLHITPATDNDAMWQLSLNDSLVVVNDTLPVITVTPGTEYEVYVRTICNDGDTSVWSLPLNFISKCELISTVPQSWGFESDNVGDPYYPTPLCWNIIPGNPSYTYPYVYTDGYYTYAHTGTHSLYIYNAYPGYAVMPELDVQTLNIQNLQITFFAYTTDHAGVSSLQVGVMTDPTDASTFTLVQTVDVPYQYGADPITVSFENYTGQGAYIAFRNVDATASSSRYMVDDLTLETIPSCPTPTALTISDVTMTSAVVAWTENGTATAWTLKLETDSTETLVPATTNPYTLTNLTPGTLYEISIQANCSATDTSPWRLPETFNTSICDSVDQCVYTFNLTDSYGDGWNGGYLTVTQNGVPVATVGLSSDSSATETVSLCDNVSTSLVWTAGSYPDEIGFTMVDPNGTQIYTISDMTTYTTYTFTTDCDGSGPQVTDPTVTTDAATLISQTTATLNGTITNPDDVTITAKGFEWKLASATDFTVVNVTGATLTHELTNLTANTAYTYKAFVTFNGTTVYGNEVNFTTLEQGQLTEPSATTLPATNVMQTTATLNGTITNPDNVTITAQGFEWKAASASSYTTVSATGATMTSPLTGLTANTAYTYRAFVTTANGTHYGADVNFTTLEQSVEPCNTPTGVTTGNVTHESIEVTWDNADVTGWNVQYRVQNGQWSSSNTTTNSYTITGLTPETTYEIQVQANCGDGNLSEWSSMVTATTTTGINSWLDNSVTLYPNPAKEYVDIRVDGELNVNTMEVYDVYGKLVNTVIVNENPTRINVSSLANGMYFVRVTTEMGAVTKTFVKR